MIASKAVDDGASSGRVHRILGVDLDHPSCTLSSSLISDGSTPVTFDCECRGYSPPGEYFVQGFSDLRSESLPASAFLGSELVFVTARRRAEVLSKILTGCTMVRVGYRQWDQHRWLPEEEWFSTEPLLGALHADNLCLRYLVNGKDPDLCGSCGRPLPVDLLSSDKIAFPRAGLPCADLSLVAGTFPTTGTLITEHGLSKLRQMGYQNLMTVECELYD